jgi:hypothetical protein
MSNLELNDTVLVLKMPHLLVLGCFLGQEHNRGHCPKRDLLLGSSFFIIFALVLTCTKEQHYHITPKLTLTIKPWAKQAERRSKHSKVERQLRPRLVKLFGSAKRKDAPIAKIGSNSVHSSYSLESRRIGLSVATMPNV